MASRQGAAGGQERASAHCLRHRRRVLLGDPVRLRSDERRQKLGSYHR